MMGECHKSSVSVTNEKHTLRGGKKPEVQVTVFCFLSGASNVKPLDGVKILDLTRFVFYL